MSFIADTLLSVWSQLVVDHAETIAGGDELEVTSLMEIRLNRLRRENAAWSQIVVHVVRDAAAMSYDGAKLGKSPDLSIYLTDHDPQFPLVVECKIIDKPKGRDVGVYCTQGLSRFILGEYSWAKSEALMMAYVRDGSTLDTTLAPYLVGKAGKRNDPFHSEHVGKPTQGILSSRHRRPFVYAGGTNAPGPIAIFHVWTKI